MIKTYNHLISHFAGPAKWGDHFSLSKVGRRQSPIDISTASVEIGSAGPFVFGDLWHDHGNGWKVSNNGHTGKGKHKLSTVNQFTYMGELYNN